MFTSVLLQYFISRLSSSSSLQPGDQGDLTQGENKNNRKMNPVAVYAICSVSFSLKVTIKKYFGLFLA